MGIRFYCPNGHKLNVKEFQAGQRGICPTCGVKMQIPLASTRPSSRDEAAQTGGGAPDSPPTSGATVVASGATAVMPSPAAVMPPAPVASSAPSAPTVGVADPLVEAGNVVWYVRPSSGGQFGPAAAEVMRNWLAEGRVAADALVWREGWRDWQEAGVVFPNSSSGLTIPGLEDIYAEPIPTPATSRPLKRSTPPRRKQAIVIGATALTVFILIIVATLVVVLMRQ
jgi:hypothetical protein